MPQDKNFASQMYVDAQACYTSATSASRGYPKEKVIWSIEMLGLKLDILYFKVLCNCPLAIYPTHLLIVNIVSASRKPSFLVPKCQPERPNWIRSVASINLSYRYGPYCALVARHDEEEDPNWNTPSLL